MALDGAALGAAIKAKMEALVSPTSDDIYTALGEVIVEELKANAVVRVPLQVEELPVDETVTGTLE